MKKNIILIVISLFFMLFPLTLGTIFGVEYKKAKVCPDTGYTFEDFLNNVPCNSQDVVASPPKAEDMSPPAVEEETPIIEEPTPEPPAEVVEQEVQVEPSKEDDRTTWVLYSNVPYLSSCEKAKIEDNINNSQSIKSKIKS